MKINNNTINPIIKEIEFNYIPKALLDAGEKTWFSRVINCIIQSNPEDIIKHEYDINKHRWCVYHGPTFKMTLDKTTHSYHCFFDKLTGLNLRFGKTINDDPICCELGPEILDLEISKNGCVPVKGSQNCSYCYKCNTNNKPTNMSFDTFKTILSKFPINLSQIAFGITGLQTNPDLPKMMQYCRQIGIIPNLTTVGADMSDNIKDIICKYAGACAVSCYTGAKQLCYKTIKELYKYAKDKYNREFHINMHILISNDNREHLFDVLKDIANNKVIGLKSIVFLRIKPCGRAKNIDCTISKKYYKEIITYCLNHNISFGFDSCSAIIVSNILKDLNKIELAKYCEPCESSKLSSYINVNCEYWSCSFAENTNFIKPINVLRYNTINEWWNSEQINKIRFYNKSASVSCPIYNLD